VSQAYDRARLVREDRLCQESLSDAERRWLRQTRPTEASHYNDRITLRFPTAFRRLLLLGIEAHDRALSKLERNSARDREDAKYLAPAMKLPGGDNAIVDIAKLRDYCLDPQHPRGRHKARVFAATLGLAQTDAEFLREALLRAAREADALAGESDEYGDRFTVDFELNRGNRRVVVRSAWIVLRDETAPRLTSCFVL
jgi:hypothetical protein